MISLTPLLFGTAAVCSAFASGHSAAALAFPSPPRLSTSGNANGNANGNGNGNATPEGQGRRHFLQSTAAIMIASWTGGMSSTPWLPAAAAAENVVDAVPMKRYSDPASPSLFTIEIPQRFFAIRRTLKGDLPDPKTGEGRRGGTIFSSGDMSKAEILGVERFPVRNLLEDEGVLPTGDLSTFTSIGNPTAIATILLRRREKDKPGNLGKAELNRESVALSSDGRSLSFSARQKIDVQKPELLLEQEGVSELYRTTAAKATLASNDGQMLAVFASALDQDFAGPDGEALKQAVESFSATDQSVK